MRQARSYGPLCAFFFCVVVISSSSYSNVHAKEYVIGVEDVSYYPLFDFSNNEQDKSNFTKELLSTFFQKQGYKFKFVALPVKRFNKWYVEEAIDFKFPDNERWRSGGSTKLNVTYSGPVLHLIAGSFVLKKNQHKHRSDIKRLGTVFGFYPTLWYDRVQNNTLELVEETSTISLVKHLLHGNIDAINIEKNIIDYNLKLLQENDDAIVLNKNITHQSYAFHFSSILYPEIIHEFDGFLKNEQEIVAALKKKYGIIETFSTP